MSTACTGLVQNRNDGPFEPGAGGGMRLPEDGDDMRRVAAALGLPMDFHPDRGRRADEQRGRACVAARRDLAADQRRHSSNGAGR